MKAGYLSGPGVRAAYGAGGKRHDGDRTAMCVRSRICKYVADTKAFPAASQSKIFDGCRSQYKNPPDWRVFSLTLSCADVVPATRQGRVSACSMRTQCADDRFFQCLLHPWKDQRALAAVRTQDVFSYESDTHQEAPRDAAHEGRATRWAWMWQLCHDISSCHVSKYTILYVLLHLSCNRIGTLAG